MKDNYRRRERENTAPAEENENQLEGRNALTEALRSGRTIDKVFIAAGETDRGLQRLAAEAKEAGAVVVPVDRRKLDAMSTTRAHQGVIALAAARAYFSIDDILQEAKALLKKGLTFFKIGLTFFKKSLMFFWRCLTTVCRKY